MNIEVSKLAGTQGVNIKYDYSEAGELPTGMKVFICGGGMNTYFVYAILGMSLLAIVIPSYAKEEPSVVNVKAVSSGDTFTLNDKELSDLKQRANHGDSDAAYKVSLHYSFSNRFDLAFEWLYLAASQNNAMGQLGMATINESEGPYKNISLAKFWLREAAKHEKTRKMAEERLKLIEEEENGDAK